MILTRISVAALCLFAAAIAFADVSKQYADFPTGFAQYLLTDAEREAWKNVRTDDEAKAFIDLFWARRDPTPGTGANELRTLIEARLEAVNDLLDEGAVDGARTDRGRVFAIMGQPTTIRRTGGPVRSSGITPPGSDDSSESRSRTGNLPRTEVWIYDQEKTSVPLGQPEVQITFVDVNNVGEYRLGGRVRDAMRVIERVGQSYLTQPNLTAVDYSVPAQAAATEATTALKTASLRAAVDAARTAAANASDRLFITYGEFVTPQGEHFVPVQLYVPQAAGMAAGTEATFFGVVENQAGEQVASFEEPVTLSPTTGGAFHARSLTLAPGKYRGIFGLAKDDKRMVTATDLEVEGLEAGVPGASDLLLSNHIYPLPEAQAPTDPFAFGGLQVVPKSDRVFRRSDELWYFVEMRNPGIDEATGQPRFSVKLSLTGTAADGRPIRMTAPAEVTPGQELKGVEGHWGIGQALPLEKFSPGEYTLKMTVKDMTLDKTYQYEAPFRILE